MKLAILPGASPAEHLAYIVPSLGFPSTALPGAASVTEQPLVLCGPALFQLYAQHFVFQAQHTGHFWRSSVASLWCIKL